MNRTELHDRLAAARESSSYGAYLRVREAVLSMLDHAPAESAASAYWTEELEGFLYLFDASPLIIEKLREHCYHLTGLRSYDYREHHAHRAAPFIRKVEMLSACDTGARTLFVPEARALGGFGFETPWGLVNIDTLKFYEVLIGCDRAGAIDAIRQLATPRVVEIGGGWGGFAYQWKTLFPSTRYIIVDFPGTILFSATYLASLFPDARLFFHSGLQGDAKRLADGMYDFAFVPHFAWDDLAETLSADLLINIASFQEMTSDQVRGYVQGATQMGVPTLYSLNRDRSLHNAELTTVSSLVSEWYDTEELELLSLQYNELPSRYRDSLFFRVRDRLRRSFAGTPPKKYRHLVGRLARP